MSRRKILLPMLLGGALLAPHPAWTCTYTNPNDQAIDVSADDAALLLTPTADFALEMRRLDPLPDTPFKAVPPAEAQDVFDQTLAVERAQLAQAGVADALIEQYIAVRQAWADYRRGVIGADRFRYAPVKPGRPDGAVPAGLPPEFDDYLRGAVAAYGGDAAGARAHWLRLLDRPAEQRRFRSIWAAFMLARHGPDGDAHWSERWSAKVRELAAEGAPDPLGLANSSYGWEARNATDPAVAIHLYRLQLAGGDPTAVWSLRNVARQVLDGPPQALEQLATNPVARGVLTAYVLADGGPFTEAPQVARVGAWIDALDRAEQFNVRGADRLAWMAYGAGRIDLAERWLKFADVGAPLTALVGAKLQLRAGHVEAAAELLERAIDRFSPSERWSPAGSYHEPVDPADYARCDLALLRIGQQRYADALDLYLRSGHDQGAIYLAERILTADELLTYVRQTWPAFADIVPQAHQSPVGYLTDDPAAWIRHLLARRLARLGRWKKAREFFPATVRPTFDAYIADIRLGHDDRRPAGERAAHLFAAAKAAVAHGPEMLGVDEAYSWHTGGGNFFDFSPANLRPRRQMRLAPTTVDEKRRIAASRQELPEPTWHYRYTGAEHAWAAAALLPDNDPLLVEILMTAGGWLKHQDAPRADRFYKALVRRCPTTALGREAARIRWFPRQPSDD